MLALMCHIAVNDTNASGKPVGVTGFNKKRLISLVMIFWNKIIKIHRWEMTLTPTEWSRLPLGVWRIPELRHSSATEPCGVPVSALMCHIAANYTNAPGKPVGVAGIGLKYLFSDVTIFCNKIIKNPPMGNVSNSVRMVPFVARCPENSGIVSQ